MIAFTAASLGVIKAASNIQELLEANEPEIFVTEGDIDPSIPPFDLSEVPRYDPERFPNNNDFLDAILNGQYEFPDAEEGGSYFLSIDGEGVSIFREVEIADAQGKTLGEFDVIDLERQVFIEDKQAKGLDRVNPNTGLPAQTPQQFVDKQIIGKTRTRITRLNKEATTTVVTANGTQTIPELAEIVGIKEFIFRLEGDTP